MIRRIWYGITLTLLLLPCIAFCARDLRDTHINQAEDAYLEGYIQALVNTHYYEFNLLVYVENRDVYLYNLPKNELIKKSIIRFIKDLPDIGSVTAVDKLPENRIELLEGREKGNKTKGIWFPQTTVLYPPMIANPRATLYSVAYREGDRVLGKHSVTVSLGDHFPIYRWRNILHRQGDLQIDVQAGVWSAFKMGSCYNKEVSELMNTDYLVGLPLSYATGEWAFRLRVYHLSTHLGDECLVRNPHIKRVNPSLEAVDFFAAWQPNQKLRLYAGTGVVIHTDRTYPIDPLYVEYGGEFRFLEKRNEYHGIYGTFFFAAYVRNWQAVSWAFDFTPMFGYEWSKLQGVGRKMRLFINYHRGYSEGQFFKDRTAYGGVGFSWGF
ncbi:MAG: DUF1207 domain-containing protein [Simkaniaceae bacterium]|nr:DUF1207 domain-containing protein [Simkaniaceae bacterium]